MYSDGRLDPLASRGQYGQQQVFPRIVPPTATGEGNFTIPRIRIERQVDGADVFMSSPNYMHSALRPESRPLSSWPTRFYSPAQAIDNIPTRRLSNLDSAQIDLPIESPRQRVVVPDLPIIPPRSARPDYPPYLSARGAGAEMTEMSPIGTYPLGSAMLERPPMMEPPPAINKAEIERDALFDNFNLSFQRILFCFTRYPAIVMIMLSSWVLWGRGLGQAKPKNETIAYSMAFATGVVAILANTLLTTNHHYCYRKSRILSNLYHVAAMLMFGGAIISLIFGAVIFNTVKNINITQTCRFATYKDLAGTQTKCLNATDRRNYLAVLLGACSLMILITILQLFYGVIGQSEMGAKFRKHQRQARDGHENQAFQY